MTFLDLYERTQRQIAMIKAGRMLEAYFASQMPEPASTLLTIGATMVVGYLYAF